MSGAFAARSSVEESDKGRVERTKVKRYWPGRAPDWAEEQQEEPVARERVRTEVAAPVIVRRADDPRMRRLQHNQRDKEEALEERRQIRAPQIVSRRGQSEEPSGSEEPDVHRESDVRRRRRTPDSGAGDEDDEQRGRERSDEEDEEESSELEGDVPRADVMRRQVQVRHGEEDEDEAQRRRAAVRARLLQQQQEEEQRRQQQQQQAEEEEEEEESSSEYETDEEEDGFAGGRLLKPVFVPKHARETVAERERLEAEEEAAYEGEKKRLEGRKGDTKAILAEQLAQEAAAAAAAAAGPAGIGDIDTDDDTDDVEGYEAWKARELRRIKRDREERETLEREALERERLKNMTEEERAAWQKANPKEVKVKDKSKWRYLQKYWHKGAYFQEDPDDTFGTAGKDPVLNRDYSGPTGEDKFDKSAMPAVMQVKNFGRSGRTKWTHLLNEDTTQVADELYAEVRNTLVRKRMEANASIQVFNKPKKFRR